MKIRGLLLILIIFLACERTKHEEHAAGEGVYYTCSMDPQVVETSPGKCPVCKMPLTEVRRAAKTSDGELHLNPLQIQLANITWDTIQFTGLNNQIMVTALLNFDQTQFFAISSRVMGRIEKLYFKNIGDFISPGARVADIYSEELNNAKQEYLLALERKDTFSDNRQIDFDALVKSARNKLLLWGMSEQQITELGKSRMASPLTSIYSQRSGYIRSFDLVEGDYVMEGGTIADLVNLNTLWAEAQIYISQYVKVDPRSEVTVVIPEFNNEEIKAKIVSSVPELVPDKRIYLLRISIPNKGNRLRPGMAAHVHLGSQKRTSLTLPIDAVIQDEKGASVWVVTGEGTFKNKMITIGNEENGLVEVTSGLNQGDIVVVKGAYLLNSEYIFKKGTDPMAGHNM